MVNLQSVAAIIFIAFMLVFLIIKRKKLTIQNILPFPILYFAMYKTKLGIRFMDAWARKMDRPLKYISYLAIGLGFIGMALITYALIQNVYHLLTVPTAAPGAALVLPIQVKGAFYVPFLYWIISIFVIATVHEFAHGLIARKYNIKVKSSGFAFLGILLPIIPAAFVEPDEKQLRKRPAKEQLGVFAAGPFANILVAFIVLGIAAAVNPFVDNNIVQADGVLITAVTEDYPAEAAGVGPNEIIEEINGQKIVYLSNFSDIVKSQPPGETITLATNVSTYQLTLAENPQNKSQAYLGVMVEQNTRINPGFIEKYGRIPVALLVFFIGLLYWLYVLNIGIGLFNLAPMGPIDGGRMLQVALQKFMKKEKADKYWKYIGLFFLALVIINVLFAFVR